MTEYNIFKLIKTLIKFDLKPSLNCNTLLNA